MVKTFDKCFLLLGLKTILEVVKILQSLHQDTTIKIEVTTMSLTQMLEVLDG